MEVLKNLHVFIKWVPVVGCICFMGYIALRIWIHDIFVEDVSK